MRRIDDFIVAFTLAMLAHAGVGLSVGIFMRNDSFDVSTDFKMGVSSIELSLIEVNDNAARPVVVTEEIQPTPATPPEFDIAEEKMPDVPEEAVNVPMGDDGVSGPEMADAVLRPRYPFVSRMRGEEGVVLVSAILAEDGRVAESFLRKSSGYPALDREAMRTMRQAVFQEKHGKSMAGHVVDRAFRFQLK